jgi:hypothetical protein
VIAVHLLVHPSGFEPLQYGDTSKPMEPWNLRRLGCLEDTKAAKEREKAKRTAGAAAKSTVKNTAMGSTRPRRA